jgi:hypothetical protein
MDFGRIRLMESLALDCPLSLEEFCDVFRGLSSLPEFEYDCENETEWGLVEQEGIEYNVSRPYERGTLEEWDGSVPVGCNFGITLMVSQDCPPGRDAAWGSAELAPRIGQALADKLGIRVYHHRSSSAGESGGRKVVFHPRSRPGRTRRFP